MIISNKKNPKTLINITTIASMFVNGNKIYFTYPAMIEGEVLEEQWFFENEQEAKDVFEKIKKVTLTLEV